MASGGYPYPQRQSYSNRSYYGGGGYSYSGYSAGGQATSAGGDYSRDPNPGLYARVNPEFYRRESGYGYEGTRSGAIDPYDSPLAKKRKIDNITICVDYVRGYCTKGARCPKPHVDYVESIDEREIMAKMKFCHDFQNKGMCTRGGCKFLHVTRREEDEFLLTGTIPQTVFKRMREWPSDDVDPNYSSFEAAPSRNPSFMPRTPGGSRPPFSPHGYGSSRPSFTPRTPVGGRAPFNPHVSQGYFQKSTPTTTHSYGGDASTSVGIGVGYMSGTGHSNSQPVTFGNYCVDFLKGTCTKESKCPLKHVETIDDPNDRDGIVKQVFCHDFMNNQCQRPFCKYIHASHEDEEVFLESGYFSPTLNARNREKMFFSDVCIDNMRNQCVRGTNCQFNHVTKVEAHNERICLSRSIFCHDFQDGGCHRSTCKLVHTGKVDEQYFLRTGMLPDYLRGPVSSSTPHIDVSHLTGNVCREFVKNRCTRGASCRFYHPTPAELKALLAQQNQEQQQQIQPVEYEVLMQENKALKERIQQLERLLADACHCITLAVGDQNPAIATLMKTIAEMAPASSLANQVTGTDSTENGSNCEQVNTGPIDTS